MSRVSHQHQRRICGQVLRISNSIVEGDNNRIVGDNNVIIGENNNVYGNGNTVYGKCNFVRGLNNQAEPGNIVVATGTSPHTNDHQQQQQHQSRVPDSPPPPQSETRNFNRQLELFFTTTVPTIFDYPVNVRQGTVARTTGLRRRSRTRSSSTRQRKRVCLRPDQDREAAPHEQRCIVCFVNVPCTVFQSCGHMCCCAGCGAQLQKCPLCNQDHGGIQQIIFAGCEPEQPLARLPASPA